MTKPIPAEHRPVVGERRERGHVRVLGEVCERGDPLDDGHTAHRKRIHLALAVGRGNRWRRLAQFGQVCASKTRSA
jgi:hypothetical protein